MPRPTVEVIQKSEVIAVNAIDCRSENNLLIGEIAHMRVQKLTLRP